MGASFTHTRRVAFSETDMAGIVHYSNYFRFLESAEAEFLESLGIPVVEERSGGVLRGWPRVDARCRFETPLRFQDTFDVVITAGPVESPRLRFSGRFRRGSATVAEAEWVTVYAEIDRATGAVRTLEIPVAWRDALMG